MDIKEYIEQNNSNSLKYNTVTYQEITDSIINLENTTRNDFTNKYGYRPVFVDLSEYHELINIYIRLTTDVKPKIYMISHKRTGPDYINQIGKFLQEIKKYAYTKSEINEREHTYKIGKVPGYPYPPYVSQTTEENTHTVTNLNKIHRLIASSESLQKLIYNRLELSAEYDFSIEVPDLCNGVIFGYTGKTRMTVESSKNILVVKEGDFSLETITQNVSKFLVNVIDICEKFINDMVDQYDDTHKMVTTFYLYINDDKHSAGLNQSRMMGAPSYYIQPQNNPMNNTGAVRWLPNAKKINSRPFSSIYLPKNDIDGIINDINEFFNEETANFYKMHGIPRKRIHLLHGRPGTGKTSVIKSIASNYNMDIAVIKLDSQKMNDEYLRDAFMSIPKDCVLVLEEVDTLFGSVETSVDDNGRVVYRRQNLVNNTMTLGGLLDMIDGLTELDNQLIIMTTNHKDRLDPAQLRPGRIDFCVTFDYIKYEQIIQMTHAFYKNETINTIERFAKIYEENHPDTTPAFLQGIFVKYRKLSFDELTNLVKNRKIDTRIDTLKGSLVSKNDINPLVQ